LWVFLRIPIHNGVNAYTVLGRFSCSFWLFRATYIRQAPPNN
jgi:hypothetical protein